MRKLITADRLLADGKDFAAVRRELGVSTFQPPAALSSRKPSAPSRPVGKHHVLLRRLQLTGEGERHQRISPSKP